MSGHKLIGLNAHQCTQRPKDLSYLTVQIRSSQGTVDGSEMGASWLVDEVSGGFVLQSF